MGVSSEPSELSPFMSSNIKRGHGGGGAAVHYPLSKIRGGVPSLNFCNMKLEGMALIYSI